MSSAEKKTSKGLHPRNPHNAPYDFKTLAACKPELSAFVSLNKYDNLSIDFANPDAVLLLNKALLSHFYNIKEYDIPKGHLCPPIPGRADYIHYMADVLGKSNQGQIPKGKKVKVLDIGVGANCIYPIIGHNVYGWSFVGADTSTLSLSSAQSIISKNMNLNTDIQCRLQKDTDNIFTGIFNKEDYFDFTLCNPPFHKSQKDAASGTQRKNKNLAKRDKNLLNFGGMANELWYPGGEIAFITKMIRQSLKHAKNCLWFSTLVSKKENLPVIYKVLKQCKTFDVQTIEMKQGQKVSRIVIWTFLNKNMQEKWRTKRWS